MSWTISPSGNEYALTPYSLVGLLPVPTIEEIAHSLALINRYAGSTKRPYSVAEHSLLCVSIAEETEEAAKNPRLLLGVLMHDAAEALTGDCIGPMKRLVRRPWGKVERYIENELFRTYGINVIMEGHSSFIKHCDLKALAAEREVLINFSRYRNTPWSALEGIRLPHARPDDIERPWTYWKDLFLSRFFALNLKA